MENHYSVLGIQSSASADEIRRAYRILARRYHPDLNPGQQGAERFRKIAEAYEVLSDSGKRAQYDANLDSRQHDDINRGFAAYERAQSKRPRPQQRTTAADRARQTRQASAGRESEPLAEAANTASRAARKVSDQFRSMLRSTFGIGEESPDSRSRTSSAGPRPPGTIERVSVIEVSISIRDAVLGTKKAIEIPEPEGQRKVSVRIPAGVRSGSVIRLRARNHPGEDLVLIVRVASHPFLSMQTRGLVAEIPITFNEAVSGANISVPTLEEPVLIKIPPGSQSGSEIRVKGRGIQQKDGTRGDLFVRLMIRVPESPDAVGLRDKSAEIESYYSVPVRQGLPKSLIE